MMEIKGALSRKFSCIFTKATQIFNIEPLIFSDIKLFVGHQKEKLTHYFNKNKLFYNIARVHPNLIPIGVIMVHFSTYARPCVHPMTCARWGKHTRAVLLKHFYRETTP